MSGFMVKMAVAPFIGLSKVASSLSQSISCKSADNDRKKSESSSIAMQEWIFVMVLFTLSEMNPPLCF